MAAGLLALAGYAALRMVYPRRPGSDVGAAEAAVRREPRRLDLRLRLARLRLAAGETYAAIEQLEAARGIGAPDGALLQLAQLYRSARENDEAAAVLEEVVSRPGAPRDARVTLSQVRLDAGDFTRASQSLAPLQEQRDLPEILRLRVARLLLLAGDWEGADALLPRSASDPDTQLLRGYHSLITGRIQPAQQQLGQASAAAPGDPFNAYLLGAAYLAGGKRTKAMYTWLKAAAIPGCPPGAITGAARLQADEKLWDAALRTLGALGEQSAQDPDYWRVRATIDTRKGPAAAALCTGRAMFCDGDPWAAEATYRAAIARAPAGDPAAQDLWAGLVTSTESRFDSPAALAAATDALKVWPAEPFFLRRRAELLLEQNRYREALEAAEKMRKVASPEQDAEVTDLLARVHLEAGNAERLGAEVEHYKKVAPADPNPQLLLAELELGRGRSGEAAERTLALYREAVTRAPGNAEAHAGLGGLLSELRRYEEAVPELRRALDLDPRILEGVPHVQLARIFRLQGRKEEASFHERRYAVLRKLKDAWPNVLRTLKAPHAGALDYLALGDAALARRDDWTALCAYRKSVALVPRSVAAWRGLAAALKRRGRFEEALQAMRRAHGLAGQAGFP